jgi:hypothetical protein
VIDSSALLADLKRRLAYLEQDLREQAENPDVDWHHALRSEYQRAFERERTALSWPEWRDGEVAQAAVAWLLATTFVRFCEDNHLLVGHPTAGTDPVWIAGPGERTRLAVEHQQAYYEDYPTHHDRDWLLEAFEALAVLQAGKALLDKRHNAVWRAPISPEAARDLLGFWRARGDDGALVHDFTDPDLDTRFLGDLYQDLSDHAKKTYALLQTPVFVEEFILDRTLTPAIEEFGLEGLKLIDPTCGSGHFLLGAFARLVDAWAAHAPNLSPRERVQKALDSIHGVDLNPFAVAIARFRLTVAALKASGDRTLTAAPTYQFHLAVGDSLLGAQGRQGKLDLLSEPEEEDFTYASEDIAEYRGILANGQYHVVVGNPPYITPKDKAANEAYRRAYPTCHRQYALSVPFMELFFRLARREGPDGGAGYVGKITSNSFMKREFGKKLIENLLSGNDPANPVDLTAVIDTSGAYIPGHGTPTVILTGRRRRPTTPTVKAVLGIRGEPGQPADPARGLVWTEITTHITDASHNGTYVTVTDLPRDTLAHHPWSLSGGGAVEVVSAIEQAPRRLSDIENDIGRTTVVGEDDAWVYPASTPAVRLANRVPTRLFVIGEQVRDYEIAAETVVINPYGDTANSVPVDSGSASPKHLWPLRALLERRSVFGKSFKDRGLPWWVHLESYSSKLRTPLSITFAFVATHNHFVLDRGGKVFKQSAPVIKLPADATEDDHLGLLAILNTSTACFWLKQVSHDKGTQGVNEGMKAETWERFFEFTGTKLQQFPLPATMPIERGRTLDSLGQQFAGVSPRRVLATLAEGSAPAAALADARERWTHIRKRMIFEQEELDWHAYHLYGITDRPLTYEGTLDTLALGERAFEIALARRIAAGEEESAWFERHGSTPITELPEDWPADYRALVEERLAEMERNPHIGLLERPEYKRRWATEPWEKQAEAALREAALDRLERPELWRDAHGAVTLSVAQLADKVRGDALLAGLLEALAGSPQYDLVPMLTELVKDQSVPYLAAYRYKESGVEKYRTWQRVWDLQRREDAGERVDIPVPPKYKPADFRQGSYWSHRGKLDVPKERFIAYPGLARVGDATPVLGWAGWDHAEQAQALARAVVEAEELGADVETLTPLLAGLEELEPWLHQWHTTGPHGENPAQEITGLLEHELAVAGLTRADLRAWRPPAPTRGRQRRTEAHR